ncbi:MAG: NUDIX hydrolase [Proteobacteria bacterium]|nr:MAG: NUDIX hydrolase [Pseudomonadota bacterium]
MPGVYVFPGGALESGDRQIAVARDLRRNDVRLMRVEDRMQARALAITAIRETFEETGVLCACSGSGDEVGWADISQGHRLDLSALRYLGRALTPNLSAIRFHARFFYTVREDERLPMRQSAELEDLRWVDPSAVDDLPVANVTRLMLMELVRRFDAGGDADATPFYHGERGDYRVEYDRAEEEAWRNR